MMGHRITQRILECANCKTTPEDGEYLWEMCGDHLCAECVETPDCDMDNIEENN